MDETLVHSQWGFNPLTAVSLAVGVCDDGWCSYSEEHYSPCSEKFFRIICAIKPCSTEDC